MGGGSTEPPLGQRASGPLLNTGRVLYSSDESIRHQVGEGFISTGADNNSVESPVNNIFVKGTQPLQIYKGAGKNLKEPSAGAAPNKEESFIEENSIEFSSRKLESFPPEGGKNSTFYKNYMSKNLLDYVTNLSKADLDILCTPEGYSHYKGIGIPSSFTESLLPTTISKDSFGQFFESGLNVSAKEVVLLEIWTNGSLHPRDALLMAFNNLSYTFSPAKIKMSNPIFSDSASYKKIIENQGGV